jgi:hypothetical protein
MCSEYELIECIGRDAVKALQSRYHGTSLYVPKQMPSDHPIACLIGLKAAKSLSDKFPAGLFTITRSLLIRERNNRILRDRRRGIAPQAVATRYGLTARTIRKVCQGERLRDWPHAFGLRARLLHAARQARGYDDGRHYR